MRVIAGKARHLQLKTPNGDDVRPTTDRIKETLFNILQCDIPGCRFLDLFAGSGGIGIEALSRGARECVFVDNAREPLRVIKENLAFTGLLRGARIIPGDALSAIGALEREHHAPFDIIFMDPPYASGLDEQALKRLSASSLVNDDTLIIVEQTKDRDFSFADRSGFEIEREKIYKTNKHVFLRRAGSAASEE